MSGVIAERINHFSSDECHWQCTLAVCVLVMVMYAFGCEYGGKGRMSGVLLYHSAPYTIQNVSLTGPLVKLAVCKFPLYISELTDVDDHA